MRWLILAAELVVALDGLVIAYMLIAYRVAERRLAELGGVRDFELWAAEMREYMAATR